MIYSDERLLKGIREQNNDCIAYLYKTFFPVVKSIVVKNSGNYEDAEDVFQDGMVILYKKISTGTLSLNCSLKTFFYSICRNLWMQRLDRKWRLLYQDVLLNEPSVDYENNEEDTNEEKIERMRLYRKHFNTLSKQCQELLNYFAAKTPFRKIALILGLKDEEYAKIRKYMCKNMLRKRIMNDPANKGLFYL